LRLLVAASHVRLASRLSRRVNIGSEQNATEDFHAPC
jgi:hypothetical protein